MWMAHGTGTVAGDGQELDAINKWYGKAPGRTEPVLIGSVKSNMGHCEGASCLASTTPSIQSCLSTLTVPALVLAKKAFGLSVSMTLKLVLQFAQ